TKESRLDAAKLSYSTLSPDKPDVATATANPIKKVVGVGALGAGIGGAAGVGGAAAAGAALTTTGTILALTPVGWAVIAGVGISAIIGGVIGKQLERDKFIKKMKKGLEAQLPNIINEQKLSEIREHIKSQFEPWNQKVRQMSSDVESFESSLKSLIAAKEKRQIDFDLEEKRLIKLQEEIELQWQKIDTEYKEYRK
ncbi:MAG: hypothetical protein F6J89_20825, partial [Symploca sp. SIO1C4]|nr:hypothetical protein [Symploca sp. SIO1C4]